MKHVLYQYAADLEVTDIDVVRPFYPCLHSFIRKIEPECEGYGLGDEKRVAGSQRGQRPFAAELEDDAESEVLAGPAVPLVVPLTASGSLTSGRSDKLSSSQSSLLASSLVDSTLSYHLMSVSFSIGGFFVLYLFANLTLFNII